MKTLSQVFNKDCKFIAGAQTIDQIPHNMGYDLPEFAFIGRSNVGKSSLINVVTGINGIAKVSKSPGRTKQINFFSLSGCAILTDLPGYGYAKVSKSMRKSWDHLIVDYLRGRRELKRVFLLVDSRRGITPADISAMELLDESAVVYQIILTKIDEISNVEEIKKKMLPTLNDFIAVHQDILATSSAKGIGIQDIRSVVMDAVNGRI